jgi:hypothetical protein
MDKTRASLIAGLALTAVACAPKAPPATIDGYKPPAIFAGFLSPQAARTGCIDAAARYYKVARKGVTPTSDQQSMRDGFYVVTLSVAGQGRPVNCTVDDNGNVSDVVRAP